MSMQTTYNSDSGEIGVSNYDRINAWLIAAIIVVGFVVLVLATMLMRDPSFAPIRWDGNGEDKGILVGLDDLDENEIVDPLDESPDLVEQVIDLSQFEKVTDAVSSVRSGTPGVATASGPGGGDGGDDREPQPPEPVLNPALRWTVGYDLVDINQYTSQLRSLGVEIGVVSQSQNNIWRIVDVGQTNKVVHSDRELESEAMYFVPAGETSKRWDRQLVRAAKVDQAEAIVVHFYPQEVIDLMKQAESSSLPAGKQVSDIARTVFKLTPAGKAYFFEVEEFEFK